MHDTGVSMKISKSAALITAILLSVSIILSACEPITAADVQGTMQAAVNKTMTALPTLTTIPTLTSTPAPTATATPIPVSYGPDNFPDNVNPLTGLTVSDPTILDRRPVLVKVSNFPREGRPHAGLSQADIVFDYSTGEGANRFLALYYGQDSKQVGPIRSGRFIDGDLVSMYQGILGLMYAWKPEMDYIYDMLGFSRVLQGSEYTCPSICNKDLGISEISWFADTAEMTIRYEKNESALKTKPDLHGMAFATIPPEGGTVGTDFTMHFGLMNESQWKYDPSSKKYLAWIDNKLDENNYTMIPWVDRNNNQQLAFSNVIVVFANYETVYSGDTAHKVSLIGFGGKMLLFRDGQIYEGTWKGYSGVAPLQFFDANKNAMQLQPGNTWICIVGNASPVSNDSAGVWKVVFGKP